MASSDHPVPTRPRLRVDWSPNFTFARKPSTQSPYSPSGPSPRTALCFSPRGDHHRQDPALKKDARYVAGRRMMRVPPSPLSPVREGFQPGHRYRRANMIVEVPRTMHPYSTPMTSPVPMTPRMASTVAPSPVTQDGARSILLSGLSESEATRLTRPVERRESAPLITVPNTPTTIHPEILQLREHLRSLGPVYLGNMSGADVLVQGVALRRNSVPSSPTIKTEQDDDDDHDDGSESTDDGGRRLQSPDSPKFRSEIMVRARVRPRQPDRRPFVIQRKFNLDELRATIPDPSTLPPDTPASSSSGRRSSIADLGSPYSNSPVQPGFPSAPPLIGRARRRSTSARHGPLLFSPRLRWAPASAGLEAKLGPRGPCNIMPIHLEYARSYLPVLAALLLSGHVREDDVLDIPIPQPQAWPQTVAHVYTGQGELTEAVRENILYLGGKV